MPSLDPEQKKVLRVPSLERHLHISHGASSARLGSTGDFNTCNSEIERKKLHYINIYNPWHLYCAQNLQNMEARLWAGRQREAVLGLGACSVCSHFFTFALMTTRAFNSSAVHASCLDDNWSIQ